MRFSSFLACLIAKKPRKHWIESGFDSSSINTKYKIYASKGHQRRGTWPLITRVAKRRTYIQDLLDPTQYFLKFAFLSILKNDLFEIRTWAFPEPVSWRGSPHSHNGPA